MVALTPEHCNRIVRLVEKKIPVRVELDIEARTLEENQDSSNVVAEISGTRKKQHLVLIGAHLDSWRGGTGATDNAAGRAGALKVMRILKWLRLPMNTALFASPSGAARNRDCSARRPTSNNISPIPPRMELKLDHALLSAYFNLDNGTEHIRGVYLLGNDMMRPVFSAWFSPFKDLGASAISIRDAGGTDVASQTFTET